MKIFNSKKGQGKILTAGPLVTATIAVIALLIVFFIFSKAMAINPKTGDISALAMQEQGLESLVAYLNTPVDVDGSEMKMSGLIGLTKLDTKYKSILEGKTKDILDKAYGGDYQLWAINNGKTMLEINPLANAKYGWIQTKIELPGEITVYLNLAGRKNA